MTDSFRSCGLGSFIAYCMGLALFLVGFGAPYWQTSIREYQGLWRYCFVDFNICEDFVLNNALMVPVPDALRGAQTLASLALVSALVAGFYYLSWISGTHQRAPAIACFFVSLAGALTAGACGVYGSHYGTPTGWAFWMCVSSAPFFLATGAFTTLAVCRGEDHINRGDYTPEMMFEMLGDKKQLLSAAGPAHMPASHSPIYKNPPYMEYPNPVFDAMQQQAGSLPKKTQHKY